MATPKAEAGYCTVKVSSVAALGVIVIGTYLELYPKGSVKALVEAETYLAVPTI